MNGYTIIFSRKEDGKQSDIAVPMFINDKNLEETCNKNEIIEDLIRYYKNLKTKHDSNYRK